MRPPIAYPFGELQHVDAFAERVRTRLRVALRNTIRTARDRRGWKGWETFFSFWCGQADGMVSVLYDLNARDARDAQLRLNRVRRLVHAAMLVDQRTEQAEAAAGEQGS